MYFIQYSSKVASKGVPFQVFLSQHTYNLLYIKTGSGTEYKTAVIITQNVLLNIPKFALAASHYQTTIVKPNQSKY